MPRSPSPKKPTPKEEGFERLHLRIAKSGLCSRRAAEQWILQGRVELNGQLVVELGVKVGPEDQVRVDGNPISVAKQYTVLLNKPTGVVSTLSDPQRRPTVVDILPDYGVQLKPIGRLDMDTEGLLLCSNDGELALRLAHPRYGIEKEYIATVKGVPTEKGLRDFAKGIWIEGGKTAPAKVEVTHADSAGRDAILKIIIHEGKKRQIRLMCDAIGTPVIKLKRVRIGPLSIKGMRPSECILLGKAEVNKLRELVHLPPL